MKHGTMRQVPHCCRSPLNPIGSKVTPADIRWNNRIFWKQTFLTLPISSLPSIQASHYVPLAPIRKWWLTKTDVKTAFLQADQAAPDLYVIPPRESTDRHQCFWLLFTASFGLENANAKRQVIYDHALYDIGFCSLATFSQLFYLQGNDGSVVAARAKIMDDILVCGEVITFDEVVKLLHRSFSLGTVVHGSGVLHYFGLIITQHKDYSISIEADDKLNGISTCPITRVRRREINDTLSVSERKMFASIKVPSVGLV